MEALSHNQMVDLLERLISVTTDSRVEWEQGNDWTFSAKAGETEFTIRSKDQDDYHPYHMLISRGDVLVTDFETDMAEDGYVEATPKNDRLEKLYRVVKRSVLRIDEVVEGVFKDLEEIGGHPSNPRPGDVPF